MESASQPAVSPVVSGAVDSTIYDLVRRAIGQSSRDWEVYPARDISSPWVHARPFRVSLPEQGWKLHISSYDRQALETLERVLPTLIASQLAFKVVGTTTWLRLLNRASAGRPQIGKFITVYPENDARAVSVGTLLKSATSGMVAPAVPSDRRVGRDGVVFRRFGAFGRRHMQTRLGEIVPAIEDPNRQLVPDRRVPEYRQPSWVLDPFEPEQEEQIASTSRLIGGRYFIVARLYDSARTVVELALDTVSLRTCILKYPVQFGCYEEAEAVSQLRHEADALRLVAESPAFPRLLDVVDMQNSFALVIEDISGQTLETYIRESASAGRLAPNKQIAELASQIAAALEFLHAKGLVHGDLKSANVMVGLDGRVRLIDLDLARGIGSSIGGLGVGTPGYMSAARERGESADPADDLYGFGAVLYFMATAAEPSRAPNVRCLLERPIRLMNPRTHFAIARLIETCLTQDQKRGVPSMTSIRSTLQRIVATGPPKVGRQDRDPNPSYDPNWFRQRCLEAANAVCGQAESTGDGEKLMWRSTYYLGKGIVSPDVNSGMSGTVLALAELALDSKDRVHMDVLRRGAATLAELPRLAGPVLPGLYIGESGRALALLRAGQILGDESISRAGVAIGRRVARQPLDSPDLFHGTAGRVLMHLLIWQHTGAARDLADAIAVGESILVGAEGKRGEAFWRIPDGFDGLSNNAYLGYAHGAAGIASVLLDLAETTGQGRFMTCAIKAMRWLERQMVPGHDDAECFAWPILEAGSIYPPFWCHGAVGIGRVFLKAARLGAFEGATAIALGAANSAGRSARWAGPTLCHGLAGNIEFILDTYAQTRRPYLLRLACELAELLDAFSVDVKHGRGWISEGSGVVTPDYMVGYAGVAVALLRFAHPKRSVQLSLEGFAYRG